MNVKIERLHRNAVIPQYTDMEDYRFDLVAVEDVVIHPNETVKVPIGLAFEIPQGYELQVRPRSGVTTKTKLRVQFGTVDASYRGEVAVVVDNISAPFFVQDDSGNISYPAHTLTLGIDGSRLWDVIEQHPEGTYLIRKGDRIAQGVIAPVIRANFS